MVTWDPRGEFASGGVLQLDSPDFEAKDVSSIITWVAGQPETKFDPETKVDSTKPSTPDGAVNNPLIGMVGGSYGGGIQLTSAGIDKRIDAIAPGIAWNSLETALYPNHGFKTSFASLLLLSLVVSGSRIDPEIYSGILTGVLFGFLTPGQREFLTRPARSTWSATSPCRRCSPGHGRHAVPAAAGDRQRRGDQAANAGCRSR